MEQPSDLDVVRARRIVRGVRVATYAVVLLLAVLVLWARAAADGHDEEEPFLHGRTAQGLDVRGLLGPNGRLRWLDFPLDASCDQGPLRTIWSPADDAATPFRWRGDRLRIERHWRPVSTTYPGRRGVHDWVLRARRTGDVLTGTVEMTTDWYRYGHPDGHCHTGSIAFTLRLR